jgi:hypothetical protein
MDYTGTDIRGMAVSVVELGRLLDIVPGRIRELLAEGMPIHKKGARGQPHVLSSADCIDWLIERQKRANPVGRPPSTAKEPEANSTKARIDAIRIEKAELDLAEKRGDLFHFDDLKPFIEDACVDLRVGLVGASEQFREDVPEATPMRKITQWLDAYHSAKLNAWATAFDGAAVKLRLAL